MLTALSKKNGTLLWEFTGAKDRYIGSALIVDGTVYAPNADHYLYVINADGNLEWKFKTAGPNWTKPVSNEKYVFVSSMDHSIYALKKNVPTEGLIIADDGSKTLLPEAEWSTNLGMAVVSDPVLDNDIIYVATIKGKIFAINANNGDVLWAFDDSGNMGTVWGKPVITEATVFIADIDGNIYAINKEDGISLWPSPVSVGGRIVGGGVALDDSVIFASDEGKIIIINEEKEIKTIAKLDAQINSPLAINRENIIVAPASKESILVSVDLDGYEVWSFLPGTK